VPRFTRPFVLAWCLAGCGGFLGLTGDDDDDAPPEPGVDASADGIGSNGDGQTKIPPTGADASKDINVGTDTGIDAPKDAPADADGGKAACNGKILCARYVFVTSVAYAGNLMVGSAANDKCKLQADATGSRSELKGRLWRAWISTSATSAAQNLGVAGEERYQLVDGTIVANDFADLVDGTLDNPIDLDELGGLRSSSPVWTATGTDGAHIAPGCSGFTLAANSVAAKIGDTSATTASWTNSMDHGCGGDARLYCFEY
jgi:hypothetical protein